MTSRWPVDWPPHRSLGSHSLLSRCSFWNLRLMTRDWRKALTAPHCYRIKFIFLSLVTIQTLSHLQLCLAPLPTPSPLGLPLAHFFPLCAWAHPSHLPTCTWPIPFLPQDSALTLPSPPSRPHFIFLSITYASAIACTSCTISLSPPYNVSSLRLGSLVFFLCTLKSISLLTYSRNSKNVPNELMKVTQTDIYLMEEFNIAAREQIYHSGS